MTLNWKLFAAVATLTGTIVGAGFLGIPYVVAKSGFVIGFIQIILIGILLLIAKLYFGEILLRTKGNHYLPGLSKIYLGNKARKIAFFALFFGAYSALVAYLIGEGESLSYIFTGGFKYAIYFAVGFWLILTYLVHKGLRELKKGESIGILLVLSILILILIIFVNKINPENLMTFNLNNMFLPVGVIIFAFLGFIALPEILRELGKDKRLLKKSILIGAIIPIVIYSLFTIVVVGFAGSKTPEIATFALGKIFVVLGVLTMFTAFFSISMAIRDMYRFDFYFSKTKAWILASVLPLVLFIIIYVFKLISFTQILGIAGTVAGGIEGVIILLMVNKARKYGQRKPEYKVKLPHWIVFGLILFLIAGLLLQLVF